MIWFWLLSNLSFGLMEKDLDFLVLRGGLFGCFTRRQWDYSYGGYGGSSLGILRGDHPRGRGSLDSLAFGLFLCIFDPNPPFSHFLLRTRGLGFSNYSFSISSSIFIPSPSDNSFFLILRCFSYVLFLWRLIMRLGLVIVQIPFFTLILGYFFNVGTACKHNSSIR